MFNAGLSLETLLQIRESFVLHSTYIKTFVSLGSVMGNTNHMCDLYIYIYIYMCVCVLEV
jgi:hypothetical protein